MNLDDVPEEAWVEKIKNLEDRVTALEHILEWVLYGDEV